MRSDSFSQSKYLDNNVLGDDIILEVPNKLYAVFDGATDPYDSKINNISVGRIAAMTAASELSRLINTEVITAKTPLSNILDSTTHTLKNVFDQHNIHSLPSSTAALAIDLDTCYRLILIGDSSIRINGTTIYSQKKIVDDITTLARVKVFKFLKNTLDLNDDDIEHIVRKISFLGFDLAISEGIIKIGIANYIINSTISELNLEQHKPDIAKFLGKGIQSQYLYANTPHHILGYVTLNSKPILYQNIIDVCLPKSDINTIEIFSDGYLQPPKNHTDISSWERAFDAIEKQDYHKIKDFCSIKGSTLDQYSDDRSILTLTKCQ